MKIGPYLFFFYSSALVLLILLRTDAAPANSSCGGGDDDECVAEEFDEFLMESEVSRRILASNQPHLAYGALEKGKACNAMIYGDCVGKANRDNRPCTLYTRCKRRPG
ncbi:hypothetical protein Acr_03g0016390 [Actinidia rufa]|uniref:Uncharacterized protein n=1 Tax=Actinidia rufa TaxID=165716 RepID=A0A7J0EEG9_9ERIC|nr:hypothetical protein Acr_03g0016320 [Actinidia rufa]GFY84865.1 hypothetical protein Acr_03g0016390 [Actinidia rufa]